MAYLLPGVGMGRLRVHHQLDPSSRLRPDPDEPVFKPHLRGLQHLLHPRLALLHADPLRRVSAGQDLGTHGISWYVAVQGCALPMGSHHRYVAVQVPDEKLFCFHFWGAISFIAKLSLLHPRIKIMI